MKCTEIAENDHISSTSEVNSKIISQILLKWAFWGLLSTPFLLIGASVVNIGIDVFVKVLILDFVRNEIYKKLFDISFFPTLNFLGFLPILFFFIYYFKLIKILILQDKINPIFKSQIGPRLLKIGFGIHIIINLVSMVYSFLAFNQLLNNFFDLNTSLYKNLRQRNLNIYYSLFIGSGIKLIGGSLGILPWIYLLLES